MRPPGPDFAAALSVPGTRLFLYEHLHDIAAAARGAAGWGGDRYMVVRTAHGDGIAWLTVWDQALDAGEFGDAAKSAIRRRFGPQREVTLPGGSEFTAGKRVGANYWGEGATTLEWSLSSPPPYHQFETLPVIEDDHDYHNHLPKDGTPATA